MTATEIEENFLRHNAGRHFVALQYRLRKGKDARNLHASCFLLELAGTWFLITSGHWLKHEETGLERQLSAGYRIDSIFLVDAFAGHCGSPLPFNFEVAEWLTLYDDDGGLDIAALEVHPFHRRGLESANVAAIELHATGPAEFRDDSQLALVGVPAESFDKKGADTEMKLVLVPLREYSGDALPAKGDSILARMPTNPIDAMHRVEDVAGMSGGPIFRIVTKAGKHKKYWLVGIQSGWYATSRVVRFSPIDAFVAELKEVLEERANAQRAG